MTQQQNTFHEPKVAYPPRFRWLKRFFVLLALLIAATVLLRLWWGHEARQHLQAEIDAIHARGEPILIEDFPVPNVPTPNAATYLQQAEAAAVFSNQVDNIDWAWDQPVSPPDLSAFRQYLSTNQTALQLVHTSRAFPQAFWGNWFTHPVFNVPQHHLGPQRGLSNLLGLNAFVFHLDHQDSNAIEAIRDRLQQSNAMSQDIPDMITHLVMVGMSSAASNDALGIAPDLRIDVTPITTATSGLATRQQVLRLIDELLDDKEYHRGIVTAIYGERLRQFDTAHSFGQFGMHTNSVAADFIHPLFDLDAVRMMEYSTAAIRAGSQSSYPAAMAALPPKLKRGPHSMTRDMSDIISQMFLPSYDRYISNHFRGLTDRRAAAIALAIRLWQADHSGATPPSLAALVPQYLPTVPIDPYAADGSPFCYKNSSAGGAIFYSVGENGTDDGGSETLLPRVSPSYSHPNRFDRMDVVYHVGPPVPAPAPSN